MAGESARERAQRARDRSQRLALYAENWEKGAEGESCTAAALERLGPEWTVWHDLSWPGRRFANIDHLAVGPSGIFVIDSKNWSGSITVKDGVLRQNGYRREPAVAGCADSALAVGALLPTYLDRLRPVMCFVREEPVGGWAREVMLCSTANVVAMLSSRPPVLGADEIADAVGTLRARLAEPAEATGASPARGRRSPPRPQAVPQVLAPVDPAPVGSAPVGSAPVGSPGRSRQLTRSLERLVAGVGVWWLATMALFLAVGPLSSYSAQVLSPASIGLALLSWLLVRRLIR